MEPNTSQEEEWKRIQVQTFRRWCNARLAVQKVSIEDLSTDLCDGVKLIVLLEVLSQKRLGKFNKKPRMHAQRMENVEIALQFITLKEKIRLVNIGSGDVVGGNLKLILGLIWTLILHYQISVVLSNPSDPESRASRDKDLGTPKENVLNYLERTIQFPGRKIRNVTTDWNDGILIATLVDSVARGLCPECDEMVPDNALQNATHAMALAEDWLSVPQVLHPEDMVNPNVDELSMMTYLSQFLTAKLKPGAPLKPTGNPLCVKVFGPGIQSEGLNVTMPTASFTVDTEGAGPGKVCIQCTGPIGPVKVDIAPSGKHTYSCSYVPSVKGTYKMDIYFSRRAVPGSPFNIQVAGGAVTIPEIKRNRTASVKSAASPDFKITGPGLIGEPLLVNQLLKYLVEAQGAGAGKITCTIHVSGQEIQCTPIVTEVKDGTFSIQYTPTVAGSHVMTVKFGDKPIPKSPIYLKIIDISKVRVSGAGLVGGIAAKWAECTIDASAAGEGKPEVSINGPTTVQPVVQPSSDGMAKVKFLPAVPGKYTINILFANQMVPGSPFCATFLKPDLGKVYLLSGPGLKQDGIVVNVSTKFAFDPKSAAHEKFSVIIVGPTTSAAAEKHSQSPHAIPVVSKNTNGTYNISYKPQLVGAYRVHLYLNGQELQESPIEVNVSDPAKVRLTGPGVLESVERKPPPVIRIHETIQWSVDCCNAGQGPLQATLQRDGEQSIDLQVDTVGKGFYTIKYEPESVGQYKLCIKLAGNAVPISPTFVLTDKETPFDITKVTAYGAGVSGNGAQTGVCLPVFINTRMACPPGRVTATLTKPNSELCSLQLKPDQQQGVYFGEYITHEAGYHKLSIYIDDKPIPHSPFSIPVCKPTAVKLSGSGLHRAVTNIPNTINILTDEAGPGKVTVEFESPDGTHDIEYTVKEISEHTYELKYNPNVPGNYLIAITYGGFPVGKKLEVQCTTMESYVTEDIDGANESKVQQSDTEGPLTKLVNLGQEAEMQFTKIHGNKQKVNIDVRGPRDYHINSKEDSNHTHTITLIPNVIGVYQVVATQGKTILNGSPVIIKGVNPAIVKLSGPGIKDSNKNSITEYLQLTEQLQWTLDFTSAGLATSDFTATVYGAEGYSKELEVVEKDAYHAFITFVPHKCGPYTIQVAAGGHEVPCSPVNISLQDPSKVTASEPGLRQGRVGKPVTVAFNATEAGEGSLSLEIGGPANVTPKCISEEPGKFVVNFEPTRAGIYTLNAKYGDKEIPGSPFSIPVINPAEVTVSGSGATGKGASVGKKAEVVVDTTEAGTAPVHVTVTTPAGKDIPLELMPLESQGHVRGEYMPQEPGNHKLSVTFDGEHIPQSPFDVHIPSEEECSVVEEADLHSALPGFTDLPQLLIDTPVGDNGTVEAWVEAPNAKQLQCTISKHGDKHKVSFFPLTTGLHFVHVTWDKKPTHGSPFPVEVKAQQVLNIEGPEVTQLAVGQPVQLQVSEGVERKGDLKVNVEGPADCKVETKQNANHTHTIELTPTTAGTYLVHVIHGSKPVHRSPFIVKVFNPSEVKLSGPGIDDKEENRAQPEILPFTNQLLWTVDFTSAGLVTSDFTATVYGAEGYSKELEVVEKDAYHAFITFAPHKCGPYTIQVAAGGREVPRSPVNISLQDPSKVTASGPGLRQGRVGKPVTVAFDATQAGEGSLSLEIGGPANVTPKCTSEEPGKFVVNFEPTRAGIYTLSTKYGDKEIPDSPFSIPVINPANVTVSGSGVTGKGTSVGKKAEVVVDTTEAGTAPVHAKVTTPAGKDIPLELMPLESQGHVRGEYMPLEPGNHKLSVTFDGEHIPQSPFDVHIPSEEECSVVEEADLHSALPGFTDLPQLLIDTPVGDNRTVEAWVEAPNAKQLQCTISKHGDKHKVSFFPLTTGLHFVHVTWDKKPTHGSPFPVEVKAQQILNIEGPGVTQLAVGQPVQLQVSEGVERKGDLKVNVEGPADCKVETKQNANHTHTIELTPTTAGTYLVHVIHGSKPVHRSPFIVKVFNPSEVKLSGPGVVDKEENRAQPELLPFTNQLQWTVDFTSAGLVTSDFTATVYGAEGYSKELEVVEKDAYHAFITLPPHNCGPYTIQVAAGGREVPRSPVNISLQDPSKVIASGPGLRQGRVGKPVTAAFDATQAGEGSLSLEIGGPANVTPKCISEEPGKFIVNFEPTRAGIYTLNAKYGDKEIPGSPFSIPVINPAEVTVSGSGVTGKGASVGKKAEVVVDTTEAGTAPVHATVTTPAGKDIPLELMPLESQGHVRGEYMPQEPGNHKLSVTFDGEHIPQSPFDVHIPSEEECSVVEDTDLHSALPGFTDLPQLLIDTPVGDNGTVEAWVEAPNAKQLQCTISKHGDKHKVSFFPLTTGLHFVHVTWDKKPTHGSPFPIEVKAQQVLNIEGPEVTQLAVGQPVQLQVSEGVERKGDPKVNVEGPADCKVETKQNANHTHTIELTPTTAGTYLVHVIHGSKPVHRSPFIVKVFNPSEVKLSGPGVVDKEENRAQPELLPFTNQLLWTVDFTSAGLVTSDFTAIVYGAEGYSKELEIVEKDAYHAFITFAPHKCGPYTIQVVAGGREVPRSPVNISLQDPSKVTASGPGLRQGRVGKPVTVAFDATQAGEGSLSLEIGGPANVTPTCISEEPGKFVVNFEPTRAGIYSVDAKYGDKQIPGSPFSIPVINPAEVTVSGSGVTGKGASVGKKAEVVVDTTEAGTAPVHATVTTPAGKDIPLELMPLESQGHVRGEYMPQEPGNHKLSVTFDGEHIPQSPFDVHIPSEEECSVVEEADLHSALSGFTDLPQLLIDTPVGDNGTVEAWVEAPNAKQLQCTISKHGDKHKVSFFPLTTGLHFVHVTRDKKPTHGSPFPIEVKAQQVLNIEGPEVTQLAVGQPVQLQVSEGVERKGDLKVNVEGPADCKVETKQDANQTHTIELTPTTAGTYLVHVIQGSKPVHRSPFIVKVFNPSEAKLSGPGVVDKEENRAQPELLPFTNQLLWTVDFTSAGLVTSDFTATVYGAEGYSKELEVVEKDAYHAYITFAPHKCGPYTIQVAAGGREVPRSPVNISLQDPSKVTASGPGLRQGRVGKPVTVAFNATQAGEGSLSLEIGGPANVTPTCISEEPGKFVVNFEPTRAGIYTVDAKYGDKQIPGSPFSISVINPADVTVSGSGVTGKGASVGKKAEVVVDTSEAGTAPVHAKVTTPAGKDIPLELMPLESQGHVRGEYMPQEPGNHKLNVTFDGEHIPQSPFDVHIPSEEECSVVEEADLHSALPGFTDLPQLLIDTPVGDNGTVEAWVEAPNVKQLQCTISKHGDKHKVSFFPLTTGLHFVHVTWDSKPTHGSPFPVEVKAQQVLNIEGPEVTQLAVGQPVQLQVSEGVERKGDLKVNVEGPEDCKVETKQNANHTHTIELTPTTAGTYLVHVIHGSKRVHRSPFIVKVFNPSEVKLSGPGVVDKEENRAQPELLPFTNQLQWTVDFTSAGLVTSDFTATVYGAEGYSKELEVVEKDAYHAFITFAPHKCGPYTIQVAAGGREVPRSPVNISLQDPSKVTASGPGLRQGRVGKPVTAAFDATQAGEGSLSLEIGGPANVTPKCISEEPGKFIVNFEPTRAGIYTLNAKYGDKEIPGSPFSIPVINPAEVTVSGSGVTGKGASVGKKAEVVVDTTEAGTAPVHATVTTPAGKDIPLELMPLESQGHVRGEYMPQEPGNHKLSVTFDGEHIPQSPFDVHIPSEEECSVVEDTDLHSALPGFTDLPQLLIDTPVGDNGTVEAWVEAPNAKQLQCTISKHGDKHKVSFFPLTTGLHFVHVTWDKKPTHGSPFPIEVKAQQVLNIEGPEVTQLAVGQPIQLQVSEGVERKGDLKVNVEGPADCKVETKQNANHTHTIELTPTTAGTYLVHIIHGSKPVHRLPFIVKVFNPSEVKLSGPGVVDKEENRAQPELLPFTNQLLWTVDFTSAGLVTSDFTATVYGAEGYSKELEVVEKDAYHAFITFAPHKCGPYTIQVAAGGREVPRSPVNISLQDPSKVTASGPGLRQGRVGKPVTAAFDATQAGEGSLSLEIGGPANVTPTCISEEPGKFVVNFEPTRAGIYTLNAKYGDKEIPGSPFSIPVINPAEVTVSGSGATGKGASVGKKAEVVVDTTEAGTAPVHATVTTPAGKDIPLELMPLESQGHVRGEYMPQEPGNHKLSVTFDGEHIPQSPFDVHIPSEEECSVVEEADLHSALPGFTDLPQLLIDTPVGDNGTVEAWVEAPNAKQLQCTISKHGDKHKVSFFPLTTGLHFVHVTRDKKPTHGSPFPVEVKAQQVLNIEGPEVTQLAVGQPIQLQVSEGVERKGDLKVNVEGPADCKVETKQNANHTHTIELTPTTAGTYLVHVIHGSKPVHRSPFIVKVFNPSEVKLSGPGVVDKEENRAQPELLLFTNQLLWTVDFTSAGLVTSDFTATVYGAEGYSKELEVVEKDAYHAFITFAPHKCGSYTIQVAAGGREVPRSPVNISLQDPSKVTASGPGLKQGRVGKPVTVAFDATQAGEGSLSLEIGGPANVTPTCISEEPGKFVVNFEPTRAGIYTVDAKYGDKEIPGSPFSIPVINPAEVTVSGSGVTGKGASVGKKAEVVVDTSEAGTALVHAAVTTPAGKDIPLDLMPLVSQGHVRGEYMPQEPGNHKLNVTFDGEHIPQSPFDVHIPSEEECSVVEEADLHSALPGFTDLPQLLIDTPVGDNGTVEAWVEAPNAKQLQCTISKHGDKHKVSFFPLTTGLHFVHVTWDSKPTHGSPFPVEVKAQQVLNIEGPEVTQLAVGQPVQLQVSEGVERKGDLKVNVEGPEDCKVETKQNANHTHTIELTPTTAGTYLVHVIHGSKRVHRSPFIVKVFNPSEVKLSGPGVVDKEENRAQPELLPFTNQLQWTVDFTSAGLVTSDFTATVYGAEGYSKELEVVEKDAYHAFITFAPHKCGPYTIQVAAGGREVPRSPVNISLQDPSKVTASGPGLRQGRVGKPVTAAFDATQAGEGSLSLEIGGPANVTPKCISEEPGKFIVNFEPTRAGIYTLNAKYGDKEIPGSPFSIPVINPAEVTVSGSGVTGKGASVGKKAEVVVDTTEAGTAPVHATVTTPAGKDIPLELMPLESQGHVRGEYMPQEPGNHKLSVTFDGERIPQSPFDVHIPSEEECSVVEDTDLHSALPGFTDLPQLLIDTPAGDNGTVEAWVEAPNAKQLQCTISKHGDKHKVSFFPLTTGLHFVHVTWDKKPTHGSPFPIEVMAQQVLNIEGPEVTQLAVGQPVQLQVSEGVERKGDLKVNVEGPADCKVETKQNANHTHTIELTPTTAGTYLVHVIHGSKPVHRLPFIVKVFNPSEVKLSGPGVVDKEENRAQPELLPFTNQLLWTVDFTSAGLVTSDFTATVYGAEGYSKELEVVEKDAYHAFITFAPHKCGPYTIQVAAGGREVPRSPVNISLQDPSKVTASGPGLRQGRVGKPVTAAFDATQAGEGSLSLEIGGPANVTPKCISEEPGKFVVNFEPTRAGIYTLNAKYGDKEIPGSPFSIPVINPAEVTVSGSGATGKGASVGKKAEVVVDTTEAGTAPVYATVTTPAGKDIPLELMSLESQGHVRGEYMPQEPGNHKLSVTFDGEHIPQSPFDVHIPSEEECSVVEEADLHSAVPGFTDLPQLLIDTPVGDNGTVEAWVEAPNAKQLQCTISKHGDKHKVSFFPLTTGLHFVHVTRDKKPTHGSPFPVEVKAQQVLNIEGPEVTQLAVGQPIQLQVSEGVERKGDLKVNVEGPADCKVETKQNANHTHTIELTPTTAGTYLVHVIQGSKPVHRSPFIVKVFNPSEVKLSGPGVVDKEENRAQPELLLFTNQLLWTVDFTSAGLVTSDFTATVYGAEGYSKELEVVEKDAYHAFITFAPHKCGSYTIQVAAGGREVPRSPVNISLQDPSKVTASGPGLKQGRVGKPVTVAFDATQAGEGSLSLEIGGPANVTPTCISEEPGKFVVNFEPTRAGIYTVDAKYGDKEIPGSPFSIPVINPAEVTVSGSGVTGKGASVGKKAEVVVDTSEAGTAPVHAAVTTPAGKDIPLDLMPLESQGHVRGEYMPQEPGNHKLNVTFDGEHIPQSPFDVHIPSEEECSVVEEADLRSALPGFTDLPQLLIDTPAGDNGTVEAWVEAPNAKQLQCTISKHGDKHKVSFFPLTTGLHFVHVSWDKKPTHGSPFPVEVKAQQVLNIEGPEVTQLAVGQPVQLQVSEGVERKGDLKVNVEGPADCKVETKQNANHTHTIELTPTTAGTYLVHVIHGSKPVHRSPFFLKVFNPSEVKLSGPGVVDKEENRAQPEILPFTNQLLWTVDFTSAGLVTSDFTATVYGAEGYSKELEVVEKDAYHAYITFAPHKCGPYTIQVAAGGREVPRSPVKISLQDPSKITASGPGLRQGHVGKPVTVAFDATQAGEGSLSLEIGGPANVTPTCISEEPGKFVVNFEPTRAGIYTVDAKYGDKEIPGSPFSIPVINPAEVTVSGSGVTGKGASVGKKAEVIVDTSEAGTAPVHATVTTPVGKDIPLELMPLESLGHVRGEYMPQEPGNHKLSVTFDGEHILQSPFDVHIPSEEECSVVEVADLHSALPGFTDLPQLLIDTPVGDNGTVEAWVEAPNAKQLQCTISKHGDKHKVSFFPLTTGLHFVHVTWDKKPTHGSPFPVEVKAQQVLNIEGPEVTQLAVGQPVQLQVSEGVERKGDLKVNVEGPADCKVETKQNANHTHTIELTPTTAGTYLVHVIHGSKRVHRSPFIVKVFNPSEVKLSGPGVVDKEENRAQPELLPFTNQLLWTVDFTSAGLVTSDFTAIVYGAEGYSKELEVVEKDAYHAFITFAPHKCGPYTIQVAAGGREVPRSPVNISLQDPSKVTASGPGLRQGRVGKPVTVAFDATQAGEGSLSLEIGGPANVTPTCISEEPGKFVVNFEPTRAGIYTVDAKYGDKQIPGSPFSIPVINPAGVTVSGSGVTGKGASVGKKAEVVVDTTGAGTAPAHATVTTPAGKDIPLELMPLECQGHVRGEYMPQEPGNHRLNVTFDGEHIPQSPFDVHIPSEEECSVVEEADLHSALPGFTDLPQLLIDTPVGDNGTVEAWVEAPNAKQLQCTISKHGDKHKVSFFPLTTGLHFVHVTRDKKPTHGSPFPVEVNAQRGLSFEAPRVKCLVVGQPVELQVSKCVEKERDFKVNIDGPGACKVETKQNFNNTFSIVLTPAVAGIYLIYVTQNCKVLLGSQYVLDVASMLEEFDTVGSQTDITTNAELDGEYDIVVSGLGVEGGICIGEVAFAVKVLRGCEENLNVEIIGPCSCEVRSTCDGSGTMHVQYIPTVHGIYDIIITYAGHHIKGSPFHVCWTRPPPDASKCSVSGVEKPGKFHIDCRNGGGCGYLEVAVFGAYVPAEDIGVKHNGDYTFDVTYKIPYPGKTTISVKWHGVHLNGSPFTVLTV